MLGKVISCGPVVKNSGEHFAILYYLKDEHYKKLFEIVNKV